METKAWWESKTVWGSVISFAAIVANAFGYSFGTEDQSALIDAIMRIVAAGGVLVALYGRVTAKHKIS